MGEIAERLYELQNAAIACGLEPDQAVDDVTEACRVAGQVAPDSEERRAAKWWPAFLKEYSIKCVSRWQSKYVNSDNYELMNRSWLEYFEPLWIAGCNYVKDMAVQNVRDSYNKIVSSYSSRQNISNEDLEKLKEYCNNVTRDLEKGISAEISKFTAIQREARSKAEQETRQYYDRETTGRE